MRILPTLSRLLAIGALVVGAAACGDDSDDIATTPELDQPAALGSVVVTTSILGDVVENLVGDSVEVEVIMPAGADPHDFSPSAQQAAAMRSADLLVVNGLGFEEGLRSAIRGAADDGVPVHEATSAIATIEQDGDHAHDHGHDGDDRGGDDHGHDDDDHGHDDDDHGHDDDDGDDGDDPHFFTDPARMAVAAAGIAGALAEHIGGLEGDDFRARVDTYLAALVDLDAEIEALVAELPADRRVLVTNHASFGYFADRYGFEVLGAVIPAGTTLAEPSAADLAELADLIRSTGVTAVFAETSAPARLAGALAGEVDGVEVVELFSESLGAPGSGGETYLDMMRTNAERIVEALA